MCVPLFLHGALKPGAVGLLDPERIAREEPLTKTDEIRALVSGLVHGLRDLLSRRLAIKKNGGDLAKGDGERVAILGRKRSFGPDNVHDPLGSHRR